MFDQVPFTIHEGVRRARALGMLAGIALLLQGNAARAELENNGGVWLMAVGQSSLERLHPGLERVRGWLDAQARFRGDSDGFDQAIVRPGLGLDLVDRVSVWVGYAWVRTDPADGRSSDEHRIWQQLLWQPRLGALSLQSRTRLEQRWLDTGDDIGWRLRQFGKFTWPLPFAPRGSLVGYDELFFDLDDTDWGQSAGFAQNRLFAGVAWRFDEAGHVVAEIGYLNQFTDRRSGPDQMNHLVSIHLFIQ